MLSTYKAPHNLNWSACYSCGCWLMMIYNMMNRIFTYKGKGKVPPGCLLVEPVTHVTRFSIPLGAKPWLSSTLSQLHTLCVVQLLPRPWIIFLRCAPTNLHTFFCLLCTFNHTQSYRAAYIIIPNSFHKLPRPGLEPASSR